MVTESYSLDQEYTNLFVISKDPLFEIGKYVLKQIGWIRASNAGTCFFLFQIVNVVAYYLSK